MNPLVSIIIPCFNSEKYLKKTICSALDQVWRNIEILVIDDGSIDNTYDIACSIKNPKIKVLSQENKGASSARNLGLKNAQGEYIQFLDSDDLLDKDKIRNQMIRLIDSNVDGLLLSGKWGRFKKNINKVRFENSELNKDHSPKNWLTISFNNNLMMHPAAWLVHRSIIDKAGYWNEDLTLNDDGEFFARIILNSNKVEYCKDSISYYRSYIPNTLSNRRSDEAYLSLYKSILYSTDKLLEKYDELETRKACANLWRYFTFEVYPDYKYLIDKAENRIAELGGSEKLPSGGRIFERLVNIFGWKIAIRIQKLFYDLGYKKLKNKIN